MSHLSQIKCFVKDLDAVEEACRRIGGLELVRGQKTFKWYGRFVGDSPMPEGFTVADLGHCAHAIRVKGNGRAYEIGLVPNRDGTPGFTLLYDAWQAGQGLEAVAGKGLNLLKQNYAVSVASRQAKRLGYRVRETTTTGGKIQLRINK